MDLNPAVRRGCLACKETHDVKDVGRKRHYILFNFQVSLLFSQDG